MAGRILTDERIRARDLYVQHGMKLQHIAAETDVHIDTLRRWKREFEWDQQRAEVLITPASIGERMKKLTVSLLEEMEDKVAQKLPVSDILVNRLTKYASVLATVDARHDQRGNALMAFDLYMAYLQETKDSEGIKALNERLPNFYRWIGEQD